MAQAQTPDTLPGGQSAAASSVLQLAPPLVDACLLHFRATDFSFPFDGYRDANFSHPASGFNQLRALPNGSNITVIQNENLTWYLNVDYGRDRNSGLGASNWAGVAAAGRYAIGEKTAVAIRLEYFDDGNGFTTGTAQTVKEYTLTQEYKLTDWLMTRAEFRTDWSNQPFFERNNQPNASKAQPTVTPGLIAYVAPKK